MKDIFNAYKFIKWLEFTHPQNYEFLKDGNAMHLPTRNRQ